MARLACLSPYLEQACKISAQERDNLLEPPAAAALPGARVLREWGDGNGNYAAILARMMLTGQL